MKPRTHDAKTTLSQAKPLQSSLPTGRLGSEVPSLFLGGLALTVTEEDLTALLGTYGTVANVTLKHGYAFAKFTEPSSVYAACALDGSTFHGKALAARVQSPENMKPRDHRAVGSATSPKFGGALPTLFVGGLSPECSRENVVELCGRFGAVATCTMKTGYAFVTFNEHGAAEAACSLDGAVFKGKALGVRIQTPQDQKPATPSQAPVFLSTPSTTVAGHHSSLFVGGFPSHVTERDLNILFGVYGPIEKITMKPKFAFIDYINPNDGLKAAATLDGFNFEGKQLGVRMQSNTNKAVKELRHHPYAK